MEVKKNPDQDLKRYRVIFLLLGMIFTLGTVYAAINYRQFQDDSSAMNDEVYTEEEVEVEQTQQEKEEKPQQKTPPKIEIVEDDVEIDEDIEIDETDTDDEEAIEDVVVPDDDEEDTGEIFEMYAVQKIAKFRGGEKKRQEFIAHNIIYPPMALDEGISGRVQVEFIVEKDGTVSNVKIRGRRRLGFGCEEAAMKVVKKMSGMWEPAIQRDKNVRMRFILPIRFQAG
jgi:periplasmic protein TonB